MGWAIITGGRSIGQTDQDASENQSQPGTNTSTRKGDGTSTDQKWGPKVIVVLDERREAKGEAPDRVQRVAWQPTYVD